jgi:transposase InsO family protein
LSLSLEERLDFILNAKKEYGVKFKKTLSLLGVNRNTFYNWVKRSKDPDKKTEKKNVMQITDEEINKVVAYRIQNDYNRNLGYKKLAWKMIDEDVVYISPASVYRILKKHGLLGRTYKNSNDSGKEYKHKPKCVHHHWHTDIAYVALRGVYYFFIFMLDGYSRYILNWELMIDMSGKSVELFVQKTIDKYPGHEPMIIHDNGSQFTSLDFKRVISFNNCVDVRTKVRHPETNGKAERFVGLARQEALRPKSPVYFNDAERVIKKYVDFYNNKRYHAGINYLRPADMFLGKDQKILEERQLKLQKAREIRAIKNKEYNAHLKEKSVA